MAEPSLPFLLDFDVVWPAMVLVHRSGDSVAVVGQYDADTARDVGVHRVRAYEESLESVFRDVLAGFDPDTVALNYSAENSAADGLTHGLYRRLTSYLEGTPYAESLVSAAPVVARVRGLKSAAELDRLRAAGERTEELFADLAAAWEPSWTEVDVRAHLHRRVDEAGLETSWSRPFCPLVHGGPDTEVGHARPGDHTIRPGEVLQLDFGVVRDGYAADLQRLYYHPTDDGGIPDGLRSAFDDVRAAIRAGFDALEPGVKGYVVDDAARSLVTDRGWPEFGHGLGHQVGRTAHDGGTLLAPRWEKFDAAPEGEVRAGEVYTLELGVSTEYGYVGQEEMVVVRDAGAEYLVDPQTEIRRLR